MTPRDFETVIKSGRVDFEKMKLDVENEIVFEILEFKEDENITMTPPPLTMEVLKTREEA